MCTSKIHPEKKSKKYRNKLIDEKAFQALLYRCCEAELEEIMSVYMKNSHDSSVFLGVSKNSDNSKIESVDANCFNLTASSVNSDTANQEAPTPTPANRPDTRLKSSKSVVSNRHG